MEEGYASITCTSNIFRQWSLICLRLAATTATATATAGATTAGVTEPPEQGAAAAAAAAEPELGPGPEVNLLMYSLTPPQLDVDAVKHRANVFTVSPGLTGGGGWSGWWVGRVQSTRYLQWYMC